MEELHVGNLYCAAFIVAKGVPLLRCVLKPSGYSDFLFANAAGEASQARADFYRHGLISGRKLTDAMRTLKHQANDVARGGPPPWKQRAIRGDAEPDWGTVFKDETESV